MRCISQWCKCFIGETERADLQAVVTSGIFEQAAATVAAFAARGVEGLQDTSHNALYSSLGILRNCCRQPGCEAAIRGGLARELAFCLENDLDLVEQLGVTTAASAAQICEATSTPSARERVCVLHTNDIGRLAVPTQAVACLAETKAAQSSPSRSSMSTCFC
jgi:hypothetical protein